MLKGSTTYTLLKEIDNFKTECFKTLENFKEKVEFPVTIYGLNFRKRLESK